MNDNDNDDDDDNDNDDDKSEKDHVEAVELVCIWKVGCF